MAPILPEVDSSSEARRVADDVIDEKPNLAASSLPLKGDVENELNATENDLNEAKELADNMSLEEVRALMTNVLSMHENDPNFPHIALLKIKEFLGNNHIFEEPHKYEDIIYEMKIEAALITNNSPYAEVRAVVSNHDDTSLPSSTVRVWVIGIGFSIALAFINQLFSIRQPSITVSGNVAQLLAFPVGKFWEKTVPDWGFYPPAWLVGKTYAGQRISLNPGPFNKKEHMLITIMATVAYSTPYTDNIIWVQYLKLYFNQPYAGRFAYQIIVALSTNFIGYGLAGLCRRFLVYPAYCVWPTSLVTIALNEALHTADSGPVVGPFKSVWRASRMKFFSIAFVAMFVYFWFPNYIFTALSTFSWMTWIAPTNIKLAALTGMNSGLGINPLPTFDWNIVVYTFDPLVIPFFSMVNVFFGCVLATIVAIGLWFTNAYNTAYLPINSNHVFDNTGANYNVSRAVDSRAIFDVDKYRAYSPAYLTAGNTVIYIFFFAIYPATLLYVALNHRYEFVTGMRNSWKDMKNLLTKLAFWKKKDPNAEAVDTDKTTYQDVHNRLMAHYPEVSELWYFIVLVIAVILGVIGLSQWETYTSPGVVFYGIALCLIFVLPIGVTNAMTGVEVTLNVLAEFIGGAWSEGNALSMNYFKTYGYITCAHALKFSNDLKLAHYIKIPPRHTFAAQAVGTLVSTFVCTGVLNFQINSIPNVCTKLAPNHFTCPGITTFFTASVLWGTIGPKRVFGPGGIYSTTLVGFPIGIVVTLAFWYAQRVIRKRDEKKRGSRLPDGVSDDDEAGPSAFSLSRMARQMHPIPFLYGALTLAPYNLSYLWPAIPVGWLSWIVVKNRHLGFWSRYNFVLSAAFSTAIAISSIIIFFALQYTEVELSWWGNNVVSEGCEGDACPLYTLAEGEYFGAGLGEFK